MEKIIYMIIRFFASNQINYWEIGPNFNFEAFFGLRSPVFLPISNGKFAYWQNSVYP